MKDKIRLNADADNELKKLVAHIQTARKRRGMSLADLADRIAVAPSTLWRLESGDPTVALGTVLQALSILGLVTGLSEFVAPEHDVHQALTEVRNLRLGKRSGSKKTFSEEDLKF